jgi:hypothetical protein
MLNDLPLPLGLLLCVVGAVLISVGPYVAIRSRYREHFSDRTHEMAAAVAFRLGALHGLILALVFSVVQSDYMEQRRLIAREAAATADVFFHLERFGGDAAAGLRRDVAVYTREVIDGEWPALRQGRLSDKAWVLYDRIYDGALDLAAAMPRQESLRQTILRGLDRISDLRQGRLFAVSSRLPALFWVVGILGFLMTAALFYVFALSSFHAGLLAAYAAYTGSILYFIFVMSNPFTGPPALAPLPFEILYRDSMAALT